MEYIVLYADDYDWDVWQEYCDVCGVSYDATCIKIKFKSEDVEAEYGESYDDDEDYEDDCEEDYDD